MPKPKWTSDELAVLKYAQLQRFGIVSGLESSKLVCFFFYLKKYE
jgi:hypothetical protein